MSCGKSSFFRSAGEMISKFDSVQLHNDWQSAHFINDQRRDFRMSRAILCEETTNSLQHNLV